MDDGSTERLLVAELMKTKGTEEGKFVAVCVTIYDKGGSDREIFGPRS